MAKRDNWFVLLLSLGLLLRLALISLPGFKYDIDAWFAWAIRLKDLGPVNFYSESVWTHYTPGYLYILWVLGFVREFFHLSGSTFYLLLKIPPIIAEMFLAWIVYCEIKIKKDSKWALIAAAMILFNPALVLNSAVWGQIDGLLSLFMILSVYLLIRNKIVFSAFIYGSAILIKPQAVAILPIFIVILCQSFSLKKILKFILPLFLTIIGLSIPFFTNHPLTGIFELITKMSTDYPVTSLNAYNFWGVVGFWVNDLQAFLNITYQNWGYILLIAYWILILVFYLKHKFNLYVFSALACLSFFFLPTRVHERYLYPAIPFLIIASINLKSKILVILTTILSLLHFINLYYVYYLYNVIPNNSDSVTIFRLSYNLIEQNSKFLDLISVSLFVIISVILIQPKYVLKKSDN